MLLGLTLGLPNAYANTSSSHPFVLDWGESGLSTPGHFSFPQNLATDENGNVYVTDLGNKRVQKFSNDGIFLSAWGSSGSGSGQFHSPAGITEFNGTLFVVDSQLHRIQTFDLKGNFITKWGETGASQGQFLLPNGIAAGVNGTIYVVDTGNQRIQKFTQNGTYISEFGESGTEAGKFITPVGIAVDRQENVYVTDPGKNKILKFDSDGILLQTYGPNFAGLAIMPQGLEINPSGNIYVTDSTHNRILLISQEGYTLSTWGSMGIANGQFKMPKDIALDNNGFLYVVDENGHRIQKFGSPDSIQPSSQTSSTEQSSQSSSTESQPVETNPLPPVNPVPGDLTKPVIIPPNDLRIEAVGGLTPISVGQAMATDASGIQSLNNNAPENFPLGVTTLIWTAIDGAGNMAIATQTVTVVDTIPPTIENLEDIFVEASTAHSNSVNLEIPLTTDAVGTISITNDAPEFYPLGEIIVTWTAIDVGSNSATQQQKVVVVDTTSPTIYPPTDIVHEATSTLENEILLGEAAALDNGEIVSVTNDAPLFFTIGNTTVTWIAGDSSGNTVSGQQLISVIDTTAPTIDLLEDLKLEATSMSDNEVELLSPTVHDSQEVIITNNAPAVFPIGETIVTWTAQDPSGNISSTSQKIQIVDTTIPSLIAPVDITHESTSSNGTVVVLGQPIADDISGISSIINSSPEEFPLGETVVVWTAYDNYGNTNSTNQIVTIVDTTPPLITAPADILIEADSQNENFIDLGVPNTSDLISIGSISNDSPESFPIGITSVTWMATDSSGNVAYDSQVITVQDTTLPEIFVPENLTFEASGSSGNVVDIGEAAVIDIIGVFSIENDSPEVFPLGETIVTWIGTDFYDNTASGKQIITVVDTVPPTITTPSPVVFEAQSLSSNEISIGIATAQDTVGIASIDNNAPAVFPIGETIVTWTATDQVGNLVSTQQTVTVVDTISPSIISPEDIIFEATSSSDNAVPLGDAIADDIVGVASVTNDAPEVFPIGETIVTWTAIDQVGNTVTDSQIITLVDTAMPTIAAPEDIIFEATSSSDNVVPIGDAVAVDAVGVASVTNDAPAVFPIGETIVTWTATDQVGNYAVDVQTITVEDTVLPSIISPEDIIFEATSSSDNAVPLGDAIADDIVGVASVTNDAPAVFPIGETIVTWTATDQVGNYAVDVQTITVEDTVLPSIISPEDIIFEATSSSDNAVPLGDAIADDIVGVASVTNDAPAVFPIGETIVTWTATDQVGNLVSTQQTVTVVDTISPSIISPEDIIFEATSSSDNAVPLGDAIADDIVGVASVTNDAPEVFPIGETIVTWTAIDQVGNFVFDSQKITVVDTTSPTLSIPEDIVVEAIAQNTPVFIGNAHVTDLTDSEPTVQNDANFSFSLGQTFVTWTAVDKYGNTIEAIQVITVQACGKPESYYNLIIGTPLDDNLSGTDGADLIFAEEGDDIISAQKGNDCIFGADGDDIIFGNEGNDNISGGDGNDVIKGLSGDDVIIGGFGVDVIDGGDDVDSCNIDQVPDGDLEVKCES